MLAAALHVFHSATAALFLNFTKKCYAALLTHAIINIHGKPRRNPEIQKCNKSYNYFFHLHPKDKWKSYNAVVKVNSILLC